MRKQVFSFFGFLILLLVATAADGGIQANQFDTVLFGRIWRVTSYYVQDDILRNPNDWAFLEPQGIVASDGVIYVSGGREEYESAGRLARYTYTSGGTLDYDGYVQMPDAEPDWWGPDGLTINASGSGYGSGVGQIVSVEYDAPSQIGVIDSAGGSVTSRTPFGPAKDISYIPGRGEFAALVDTGGGMEVAYYDASMTVTGLTFPDPIGSSAGLAGASASFGSWFTQTTQTQELLLAVGTADGKNVLVAMNPAGETVGGWNNLPIEPKARISLGGGFYEVLPAFGSIEAIAVDETDRLVFLGDYGNSMIHVLTEGGSPSPGDANLDSVVDSQDLESFAAYFGAGRVGWAEGDFNNDGRTDLHDFAILRAHFEQMPHAVTIPEPMTAAILGIAGAALCLRRRRGATNVSAG